MWKAGLPLLAISLNDDRVKYWEQLPALHFNTSDSSLPTGILHTIYSFKKVLGSGKITIL